jgi:hypothetical protein
MLACNDHINLLQKKLFYCCIHLCVIISCCVSQLAHFRPSLMFANKAKLRNVKLLLMTHPELTANIRQGKKCWFVTTTLTY